MTREEAINEIKSWDFLEGKEIDAIHALIPELAESDDERILQTIIRGFKNWKGNGMETFNNTKIDDILAYLEKQKEQKPAEKANCIMNIPELTAFEQALTNFIGYWEDDEEHWPSQFVKKHGKHILDMAREELKKEKKPVQFADEREYVRTLKGLVSDFIRSSGGGITDTEYYQKMCDWLDGRHVEQKPAEWSEKHIADIFEKVGLAKIAREQGNNELINALLDAMLELSKVGNAEWSEVDQENLTWLCRIIHSRVVNKEISLAEESELGKWIDKWINHGPKPEQEWDEFDKDCLNRAIWYVENPAPSVVKDTNLVLWLKSLPLNLKKKNEDAAKLCSNEWSEEDDEENIQTRFAFYTYKDDPSTLYLSNVFVEESSRNHGFGTRILRAAEKVAETIGATTIRLKVKQDSPANAWYRKNGYGYVTFEDGYDWLEKNLEYIKPKKSIKWSGDDELMIESLIAYLKGTEQDFISNDMVYWLKSLPERFNLQSKQEWSEEDEKMLNLTKTQLRILQSHLSNTHSKKMSDMEYSSQLLEIEKCVSWLVRLKSLRHHWKPSKEQMRALQNAVELTAGDIELVSLYNQLKKL